jgi:hypothetical protein
MAEKMSRLDPKFKRIFGAYPVRNPVSWRKKKGVVIITYAKNFTRFEKWLHRYIGGPKLVRRLLDEKSSLIWELSDGRHSIKEICDIMDECYHEEIEPVFEYVHNVLLVLLERNLLHLEPTKPARPLPYRKMRVLKKKVIEDRGAKGERRKT